MYNIMIASVLRPSIQIRQNFLQKFFNGENNGRSSGEREPSTACTHGVKRDKR